jgi:DNA polymerase I-like protein with 3'-5' exonuclease and polymerase domains
MGKYMNKDRINLVKSDWRPVENFPTLVGKAKEISFDVETYDPNLKEKGPGAIRKDGYICGFSVATNDGFSGYYPIKHAGGDNLPNPKNAIRWLKDQLTDNTSKVGANLLYDAIWLKCDLDIRVKGKLYDIQVAEPLLDENKWSYSLNSLSETYLGESKVEELLYEAAIKFYDIKPSKKDDAYHAKDEIELISIKKKDVIEQVKGKIWEMPARFVGPYGDGDATLPMRIFEKQREKLKEEGLWKLFDEIETEILDLLLEMWIKGVPIDYTKGEIVMGEMKARQEICQRKIKRRVGKDIDIWSAKECEDACKILGLEYPLTDKENPSFKAEWLQDQEHDFFKLLLEARQLDRSGSVFIQEKILNLSINGRIHPQFWQVKTDRYGTGSGRFSSSNPNAQQFPARNEELATKVRSLIVAEKGCDFGIFDWCFSDDTEVLTKRGWKLFKNLNKMELIANIDRNTKELFFEKPLAYQKIEYKGTMVNIVGKQQVDLLVSPNHNCLLYKYNKDPVSLRAKDFPDKSYAQLQAGIYKGKNNLSAEKVTIIAAIQADACNRGKGHFRFSLKKDRKINRLISAMKKLKLPINKKVYQSKPGFIAINLHTEKWIEKYLDITTKTFKESILELAPGPAKNLLFELGYWDGSYKRKTNWRYLSTNITNVELMHRLCVQTGIRGNIKKRILRSKKQFWTLSMSKKDFTWIDTLQKRNVQYNGYIYCVTMPKHTVVVRRNGRSCITGQSQQEPRLTVHYANLLKLTGADKARDRYISDPDTDYHQMVADMTNLKRKVAKFVNLGLSYGMGAKKFATKYGFTLKEAYEIFNTYHEGLPFIKELTKQCERTVNSRGFIKTLLGRHCHFDLYGPPRWEQGMQPLKHEEALKKWGAPVIRYFTYRAMNRLIQGSAADMIKKAMVDCYRAGYIPCLTEHDELDFCDIENTKQIEEIHGIMLDCVKLLVPLKLDVEVGPNWGECEEVFI